VNHTRLRAPQAVPTPLFALDVQRAEIPGFPKAAVTVNAGGSQRSRRSHPSAFSDSSMRVLLRRSDVPRSCGACAKARGHAAARQRSPR